MGCGVDELISLILLENISITFYVLVV